MLSQALADAVADRGAYPLGAHVRDELAPAGRRFDPWSATVIGPQVPPTALAADDAPWTGLWASDPKAVGRLRPLTHAVGRSLAKTAEQHKTVLTDTAREYGERKIKASICGPHSREGDREGGEGLAGKGHKRQRHEDLGAKKRYATSIKYRGAPARALTKTELYAQPRPATKKHLVSQCLSNKPWFGLFELPPTLPPTVSPPPPSAADPYRRNGRREAGRGDFISGAGGACAHEAVHGRAARARGSTMADRARRARAVRPICYRAARCVDQPRPILRRAAGRRPRAPEAPRRPHGSTECAI